MARIDDPPETHYTLPPEFAAALGQCVANFGWLEEVLKRTIYALDRARLADDLTKTEMKNWLHRIDDIADDSMGTLIDQLGGAMRRHPGLHERDPITDRLADLRLMRNLLCHASWRPTQTPDAWHPAFVSAQGKVNASAVTLNDLRRIAAETLACGASVLGVMHATGVEGHWAGDEAE